MQPVEALADEVLPADRYQRLHALIAKRQGGKIRAAASHWRQTWKLSPQPPFSFGLVNVNPEAPPAACRP